MPQKAKKALQPKMQKKKVPQKTGSTSGVAINTSTSSRAPVLNSVNGTTRIVHREVMADSVLNSVAYSVNGTYAVQPALSVYSHGSPLGSWLPKVAKEYDCYEFETLKVHYIPTCSTLTPGLVVISYDPNPDGAQPATFADARNASKCVTAAVRTPVTLDLSSVVKGRKLLTRSGAVASYPNYDAGRIFTATTAGDSSQIGYFEVEYAVRLSHPQSQGGSELASNVLGLPVSSVYRGSTTADGVVIKFGTTDAVRDCSGLTNKLIYAGSPAIGEVLLTANALVSRTVAIAYTSTNQIVHSAAINTGLSTFCMKRLGQYKITATLPGDWQNIAMFGAELLRFPKAAAMASSSPSPSADVCRNFAGEYVEIPTSWGGTRGFKTVEVGGNESDDLVLQFETTFVVLDVADRYMLSIGMRNNASVSENATGSYTFQISQGAPVIRFDYLGLVDA